MDIHLHDAGAHGCSRLARQAHACRRGFTLIATLGLIAVLGTVFSVVINCILARTEVFRGAKERQYAVLAEGAAWQEYHSCLLNNEFLRPDKRTTCSVASRQTVGDLAFDLNSKPIKDPAAGGMFSIATDIR